MNMSGFGGIENLVKEVYDELDSLVREGINKYIGYSEYTSIQTQRINLKSRKVIILYNSPILKDKIRVVIEYWMDSVIEYWSETFLKTSRVVLNIKAYDKDNKIIKEKEFECYPFNPVKVYRTVGETILELENTLIKKEANIIRDKIKKQFESYGVIVDDVILADPDNEVEVTTHIHGSDYINFKGYLDSNGNFVLEKVEIECSEKTTRDMVKREIMPKIAEFIMLFKLIP